MPVYCIRAGETGPVKIGFTAGPVRIRLAKMQTDNPARLTVIRWLEGDRTTEAAIQARYQHIRLHGDWFAYCDTMMGDLGVDDVPAPPTPPTFAMPAPDHILSGAEMTQFAEGQGMSIWAACHAARVSSSAFSRWRSGKTSLRLSAYRRLLHVVTASAPQAVAA